MVDKRINKYEFDKALEKTMPFEPQKRKFVEEAFKKDLSDGKITEYELNERMKKIKYDSKDPVDQWEADKIKNNLMKK